jgi:hypothetical protein
MDELVDSDTPIDLDSIPYSWPKHFDTAIRQLNDRIRPSILRTPRELLFSLAITPDHTPPDALEETSIDLIEQNLSLADMLHMQAHLLQLEDAERQKSTWDNRTAATDFRVGDVVQWHNGKLDGNFRSENKLLPRWSMPHIISGKSLNSYTLSTLHGTEIPGFFHSRRLQRYIPLRNSNLALSFPNTNLTQDNNPNQPNIDDAEERMATEWNKPDSMEELPACNTK